MPIVSQRLRALQGERLAKPYLDVKYINPHTGQHFKSTALIDTGADHCILPHDFAELLGHNLEQGVEAAVVGVSGEPSVVYKHTMQIQLHDYDYITPEILIAFSKTVKAPILGVKTFLSNFVLTVNYPDKTFSLQLPNNQSEKLSAWDTP